MKRKKHNGDRHTWRFFRAGGFDQVGLESAQDLLQLEHLDQKLWVALACPTDNVHFNARTLSFIDADGDHRIRPAELIKAVKWTASLLKNPDDLIESKSGLTVESISDATGEGRSLIAAMKSALSALGKRHTDPISIDEIQSLERVLSQKPYNGDGIITEAVSDDTEVGGTIREIVSMLGAVMDRSGKPGVNAEKVETFFSQAQAYEAWKTEPQRDPAIRPKGDASEKAAEVIAMVRGKIDDYFARCAIAAFDEKAAVFLNGGEKQYESIGGKPLSVQSDEIAELPLSRVTPNGALALKKEINPAWADRIKTFEHMVVLPHLGSRETLTHAEWQGLLSSYTPLFSWRQRKPAAGFDTMDATRIHTLLHGDMKRRLLDMIAKDTAESPTFAALTGLEKLACLRRDLYSLCTNFVNFRDFYSSGNRAIFQAGTLYLDQRSCNLCLKVDDPNMHASMAAMAGTHLVYCECRRPGGARMNIVAAFTNGDSENLMVGRNGVFYDRTGNDWDATIIKIIENPISLRQAFWLPYKSLVRMIESQVAKRATAAEAQTTEKMQKTATTAANIDKSTPVPPPKKLDIGVVAALGVAAGALGTFVATLLGYFSGIARLGPLAIVGALLGLLLLISGPSLVLAYIKLRKRNLGPILDASGWAVNAKARINVPFGTVLTHVAALPPGSQRDLRDPYAEKKSPWPRMLLWAVIIYIAYFIVNQFGFINEWTNGRFGTKKEHKANTTIIENKTQ